MTQPFTLICAFLFFLATTKGQSNKVPPFRITQPNGSLFKASDLPMGKPIILIYFSPDCDHCQKLAKELTDNINGFKKASIAMITYQPLKEVNDFVLKYKLKLYPNLYVGTEGSTLFVRNYYQIEHMPFIALHDKGGNLVKMYRKEGPLTDLVNQLNKLK